MFVPNLEEPQLDCNWIVTTATATTTATTQHGL
jgi:hypothetical protein